VSRVDLPTDPAARRETSTPASFTMSGFTVGATSIGAFAATTFAYGLVFGVLADQNGLSLLEAVSMSALVYSGSAQLVALQVWAHPLPLLAILTAVFAMNARYILLGAALRPWFSHLPAPKAYGTLAFLVDGNWALAMREHAAGRADAAYLLGGGVTVYVAWVAGTGLGHALGAFLGPPERLGLDFMLPAFCAVLAVALWKNVGSLWPFATAAAVAAAVAQVSSGPWYVLAGGLAGSIVGALRHVDEN